MPGVEIYDGIGKANFTLSLVNSLHQKPANIDNINAELKSASSLLLFFSAMDMYGNVQLVTDFNTDPNSVTNSSRKEVFDFLENELKENVTSVATELKMQLLYGRITKWGRLYTACKNVFECRSLYR
jgi:hypothetical protein